MNFREIIKSLKNDDSDFIYSALQIENHSDFSTSRLRFWFDHLKKNHQKVEGDIFEFGVFRGSSLLSMALLAKRLGSSKIVYGFDSFQGFPSYSQKDELEKFKEMELPTKTKNRIQLLHEIRSANKNLDASNISAAGDFSDNSISIVRDKIEQWGLDNIKIIEGDFASTVPEFFDSYEGKVFSANIDCDLYEGYKISLTHLEKFISTNGYIHLDEYYSLKFPGAKIATDEFLLTSKLKLKQELSVLPHEFERWYLTKI